MDQPIYGLQVRGLFENDQPAATLDEMAFDYISQIRRVQPHGPYKLLGYSFRGTVAHTMASYLEQQGERVVLLGIMDSLPGRHGSFTREDQIPDIMERLAAKKRNNNSNIVTDVEREFWRKAPEVGCWNVRLASNHSNPSYSGNAILFRAAIQQDATEPVIDSSDWERYIAGKIDVYDLDCVHDDMAQQEHLAKIGAVMA